MAALMDSSSKADYLKMYSSQDTAKTSSSKKDYLLKYVSSKDSSSQNKKKRRKKVTKNHHGCKIIDDDIDVKQLIPSEIEEVSDHSATDDEIPTVHAVEDYSAHQTKFDSSQWKKIGDTSTRIRHDSSGSDQSVTRKPKARHDSDSDQSLSHTKNPARKTQDSRNDLPKISNKRHDSDSDQSPSRKEKPDQSPPRSSRKRFSSGSDQSPPRKTSQQDSDASPPRKRTFSTQSFKRDSRHRNDSNDDQSPPKKQKSKHHDSGSDQSPPRSRKRTHSPKHQQNKNIHDSDTSPPRRSQNKRSSEIRLDCDGDLSPPRFSKSSSDNHSKMQSKKDKEKPEQTLSGLKAGLQSARVLRTELQQAKVKEKEHLKHISEDVLGKGAQTIFRDRSTGKLRDLKEENRQEQLKKAKEDELKAKYVQWGKGLQQRDDSDKRLQEDLYEMSKPLARYEGDADLERHLKEKERLGDPMLEFIRKKKVEGGPAKPTYKGPPPPPNRFNIMPGYRWDGVDRSNGFEKKTFEKQSSKVALEEEAYRWSTENM